MCDREEKRGEKYEKGFKIKNLFLFQLITPPSANYKSSPYNPVCRNRTAGMKEKAKKLSPPEKKTTPKHTPMAVLD
jgi:hypothetical protein